MIVLCVTGSVAATQSIKLARDLKRRNVEVQCFMSESACEMINPNVMQFATGNPVITKLTGDIEHVKFSQEDLILVAPATANIISKFAYKIADNPISALLIAAYGHGTPILFVPAMHDSMYKAIEENIKKIQLENSAFFMSPRMDEGKAKFPNIKDIILKSLRLVKLNGEDTMNNEKILISMGGTYEPIDEVRGITNKSSGKMGLALAEEAYSRGADVTIVAANIEVEIPTEFKIIRVETSKEMNDAILDIVSDFDMFISTAAVSDFEFVDKFDKKVDSSKSLFLNLQPTTKIIRKIKEINPDIFLVGFKAEFNISRDEMIEAAFKQIEEAGTDLVVVNDISKEHSKFGSDETEVLVVGKSVANLPRETKTQTAKNLFDLIHGYRRGL